MFSSIHALVVVINFSFLFFVGGSTLKKRNVQIISVINNYLEYTRIYHFENTDNLEAYLFSDNSMSRNLFRRVELQAVKRDHLKQPSQAKVFERIAQFKKETIYAGI